MKKNLGIKFLALFLTIFIWFEINLTKSQKLCIRIPIAITNTPTDLIPLSIYPENMELTIEGRGNNILSYKLKKQLYYIDLKDAHYGKNYYPIEFDKLALLEKYNLTIVHKPSFKDILITMDNMSSKIVPVKVTFVDEESKRVFTKNNLTVFPENVQIKGPKTLLAEISEIPTTAFSAKKFDKNPEIELAFSPDKRVSIEKTSISIKKRVPKIIQKAISLLPILTPKGIEIFPKSVSIEISGEESILQNIMGKDFAAHIDTITALQKDSLVAVKVIVPKGVKLIAQTPSYVKVKSVPK